MNTEDFADREDVTTEVQSRADALYVESRDRFESWAAIDAGELPGAPVDAMQVRLLRWQERNFSRPDGGPSDLEIALGCVEEVGETFEGGGEDAIVDGIGDVCVYLGQLFASNRLALGPAIVAANELSLAYADRAHGADDALVAVGYFCHVVLKRKQKIRGMEDDDEFRRALFAAGVDLIVAATDHLIGYGGRDMLLEHRGACGIYLKVGEKVLQRNWKKDPRRGGEA